MTAAEAWLLLYCIGWTIAGHWYALRWWEARRKHKRRSAAAVRAAATRKQNAALKPGTPGRGKPTKTLPASWLSPLEDESDEVEYNEMPTDQSGWR